MKRSEQKSIFRREALDAATAPQDDYGRPITIPHSTLRLALSVFLITVILLSLWILFWRKPASGNPGTQAERLNHVTQ